MNSYLITSEPTGSATKTYSCAPESYGYEIIEEISKELNVELSIYLGLLNELQDGSQEPKWINLDLPINVQEIPENSILRLIPRVTNLELAKKADSGDFSAQYEYGTILEKQHQLSEAAYSFKSSALQKYPPALCKYGFLLYHGILVLQDRAYGRQLILSSAESGYTEGQYQSGLILEQEGSSAESLQFFKKAADSGHIESQYRYATLLLPSNLKESMKYFKMAADLGHSESQYRYGDALMKTNKSQAQEYLLKAAEAGHPVAQLRLATLQPTLSEEWIQKALQTNSPQACYEYALILLNKQSQVSENAQPRKPSAGDKPKKAPKEAPQPKESKESQENDCKAINYLTMAADKSYIPAQVKLGQLLYPTDINRALYYLKLAADQGDSTALWMYGDELIKGRSIKKNIPEGTNMIKSSADQKNIDGIYLYAKLLESGTGTARNLAEAKKLFLEASSQGHSGAMCSYGVILSNEGDYTNAIKYFQDSISHNNALGYYHLGRCYMRGTGVPVDYKIAMENYTKGDELGDSYGSFGLGVLYQRGYGVKVDYTKAISYYNKAIEQDNTLAMNNLAVLHSYMYDPLTVALPLDGKKPTKPDKDKKQQMESKCFQLFKRAAELGDTFAAGNLGIFYENGQGTEINASEAVACYQRAADDGIPWAIYNLADMNERGVGTPKDMMKAAKLYQLASEKGEKDALAKLGLFTILGVGKASNVKEGLNILEAAMKQKSLEAPFILGDLYFNGDKVSKDLEKARHFYSIAASAGHRGAIVKLEAMKK